MKKSMILIKNKNNFKTLGNPLIIRKLTKNFKRFAPRVNGKNLLKFCKVKRNGLFGEKERENAFAA